MPRGTGENGCNPPFDRPPQGKAAMTSELGRPEDLPADYREALTQRNLVPLWPNLRGVLRPGKPGPRTRATH